MEPTPNRRDLRVLYLYEWKLGHNAVTAACNINEAFGQNTVNKRTLQRWFQKFNGGDMNLEDQELGRPESTVNNEELKALVEGNPRQTVRDIAVRLQVCPKTVSNHLRAIGKVKKLDQWVPHALLEKHKQQRLEVCSSLAARNERDPFLDRIVTCDEKWILYDNCGRSAQWVDAAEPPKKMAKPALHPKKTMVTVWWTSRGVVHYSFLKPGSSITAQSYCQEIDAMHHKLRQKQPALVNRKGPILLQDNARPHVARMTLQKLHHLGYELLSHPAYSPDLSPTDFHFFRSLTVHLNGKRFVDQQALEQDFHTFVLSRPADFYHKGIFALATRWQQCIAAVGDYFD